ncbi:DsbA family protein [Mesorhizobium kowhaii]|uniref:Disulfide bond formation protein DsbA n=1 Tax=Mesorhizobium kowhaii TaxID=1300272 RepID=A0A2W7CEE6_9HYPH|nr:DsbA family protein [Mesorhizobium kowhaii]PZV34853.1 disulfide bond formation protein DsbA [Mesorhizobium kowhaii]
MFKPTAGLVIIIVLLALALLFSTLGALHHPGIIDTLQQLEDRRQLAAELKILIAARGDALFNDPAAPTAGNPEGDVALVIFFDYNCRHCREAALNIQQAMKDDRNLKLVFKEFPILGPTSKFAAVAALASQKQGKYEAFNRALMGFHGVVNERTTLTIAEHVGLDVEQLERDMEDPAIADAIARNRALAGDLYITGTPALVVGDEVIAGVVDVDTLQRSIANARSKPKV